MDEYDARTYALSVAAEMNKTYGEYQTGSFLLIAEKIYGFIWRVDSIVERNVDALNLAMDTRSFVGEDIDKVLHRAVRFLDYILTGKI